MRSVYNDNIGRGGVYRASVYHSCPVQTSWGVNFTVLICLLRRSWSCHGYSSSQSTTKKFVDIHKLNSYLECRDQALPIHEKATA